MGNRVEWELQRVWKDPERTATLLPTLHPTDLAVTAVGSACLASVPAGLIGLRPLCLSPLSPLLGVTRILHIIFFSLERIWGREDMGGAVPGEGMLPELVESSKKVQPV